MNDVYVVICSVYSVGSVSLRYSMMLIHVRTCRNDDDDSGVQQGGINDTRQSESLW